MTDFYPADVGRDITAGGGLGTITGYTDASHVTVQIKQAFDAVAFNSGDWTIEGTPLATCTPSAAGPVGKAITLTLNKAGWRAEDVGKHVEINGGLVRLTSKTSDTIMAGVVVTELISSVAAEEYAWVLNASVWGGRFGYPRCGTLYQQRHWLAGSPGFPETVWASVIGEYFDFQLGVYDDEAMAYDVATGDNNPIQHLVDANGLVALTTGAEVSIRGGAEKPLTPTNIQTKSQSGHGCAAVMPARVGAEVYMVQRAGRKIRALAPDRFDSDAYGAPDMSVLSEHMTESGITALAWQSEPDGILYAVRGDGLLATLTVDRDQDVIAWARQRTDGAFESVDTIPTPDGARTFVVVARIVDGVQVRYIEMLDPGLLTDCALTGHDDAGKATWTGLDHLEGRLVEVKADGIVLGKTTVTGGQVVLPRAAYDVEIGLNYITTIRTLTPEALTQAGTAQGSQYSVHEVWIRVRDSIGGTVNLQELPVRTFGPDSLDQAPAPWSGVHQAGNLGWAAAAGQTLIQQTQAYPFHLLSVVAKVSVNNG